jgi:hypothetical protein
VPKLLTEEQEHERGRISKECFRITPILTRFVPADFNLFSKVKEQLGDITLAQDIFNSSLEQVIKTITSEEFVAAYTAVG